MADTAAPPGAGTAPATTPSATEEPHTEAGVRAAALDEFDSFASGDYGSTWDRYYGAAKKAISRADYVRLLKLCPDPAAGVRFQIEKVSMDGDRAARRVRRMWPNCSVSRQAAIFCVFACVSSAKKGAGEMQTHAFKPPRPEVRDTTARVLLWVVLGISVVNLLLLGYVFLVVEHAAAAIEQFDL